MTDSQANFLWIRVRDLSGDELANALRKQGVIVAPGGPLGEDHHIRAAVRNEPATKRLLRADGERAPPVARRTGRARGEPSAHASRSRAVELLALCGSQRHSMCSAAPAAARDCACSDWRSSAPVVCSRMRRQAAVFSRSSSNFFTTLRTRVAEMSMPCFAQVAFSSS